MGLGHTLTLLLEVDPMVQTFCEQPAYVEGDAGRVLDLWVDQSAHSIVWILSGAGGGVRTGWSGGLNILSAALYLVSWPCGPQTTCILEFCGKIEMYIVLR